MDLAHVALLCQYKLFCSMPTTSQQSKESACRALRFFRAGMAYSCFKQACQHAVCVCRCKFEHPWDKLPVVQFNSMGLPLRQGKRFHSIGHMHSTKVIMMAIPSPAQVCICLHNQGDTSDAYCISTVATRHPLELMAFGIYLHYTFQTNQAL